MVENLCTCGSETEAARAGPLGPWLGSFVRRLGELGYAAATQRWNVDSAADLGRWMADHGFSIEALDESVVAAYVKQRGRQRERRRRASALVLAHLRVQGVAPPLRDVPSGGAGAALTQRYAAYMRTERGAAEGTIEVYVAVVRDFLERRFGSRGVDLAALTASDVGAYLVQRARTLSPTTVSNVASALRSFLRFLFLEGRTATDLSTAALTSQSRHGASLPRYLSPAEVERLLDTCDCRTPAGRRDRAILLLLVRLGLRAGEVAALELGDIRWRSGEIVVRGKGDVVDRLPLLSEVGEALSAYLAKDRRAGTATRRVFLRLCPPVRDVAGRSAISSVVRKRIAKAGLRPQVRGAHLLRHTLGTRMIRAGASMAEIAEVLRHHSPGSTSIYAKVDFEALRALAQPWPDMGGAR